MNKEFEPSFTLLAGPNGAGKSTFYRTLTELGFCAGKFINPDEIAVRFFKEGKIREQQVDFRSGREALRQVSEYITSQVDFSRESTLSGHEILRSIERAKEAGFETNLIFIGLNSVELSIHRVATRVASGGHNVPMDSVRRRYEKSIRNAAKACRLVDNVIFFDNSSDKGYYPLAKVISGRIIWLSCERRDWLNKVLKEWTPIVKEDK